MLICSLVWFFSVCVCVLPMCIYVYHVYVCVWYMCVCVVHVVYVGGYMRMWYIHVCAQLFGCSSMHTYGWTPY